MLVCEIWRRKLTYIPPVFKFVHKINSMFLSFAIRKSLSWTVFVNTSIFCPIHKFHAVVRHLHLATFQSPPSSLEIRTPVESPVAERNPSSLDAGSKDEENYRTLRLPWKGGDKVVQLV